MCNVWNKTRDSLQGILDAAMADHRPAERAGDSPGWRDEALIQQPRLVLNNMIPFFFLISSVGNTAPTRNPHEETLVRTTRRMCACA